MRTRAETDAILDVMLDRLTWTPTDEATVAVLRARFRSQASMRALVLAEGPAVGPARTEAAFWATSLEFAEERLEHLEREGRDDEAEQRRSASLAGEDVGTCPDGPGDAEGEARGDRRQARDRDL